MTGCSAAFLPACSMPAWRQGPQPSPDLCLCACLTRSHTPMRRMRAVIGTRRWINSLELPVTAPWRPWRSASGQVGGWTVEHAGGLTFASVRGAGHMVPLTQPERALWLFSKWVAQEEL